MLSDRPLLFDRAVGKEIGHALGKHGDILGIVLLTPFSRTFPGQSTSLGVGEAFLLRSGKRLLFNEHALSLVALAGTAEAHDHSPQRRISTGSSRKRGISSRKEYQVVEIGATQAERPLGLHAKKPPLAKLLAALRAG